MCKYMKETSTQEINMYPEAVSDNASDYKLVDDSVIVR